MIVSVYKLLYIEHIDTSNQICQIFEVIKSPLSPGEFKEIILKVNIIEVIAAFFVYPIYVHTAMNIYLYIYIFILIKVIYSEAEQASH